MRIRYSLRSTTFAGVFVALLSACAPSTESTHTAAGAEGAFGPRSEPVERGIYEAIYHVAASGSDASGDGSAERPWASVRHALSQSGGGQRAAVLVGAGTYRDSTTIEMKSGVDLYGGFEPSSWTRDVWENASVLDGEGTRRVLVGADDAVLDGFTVRGGSVQGPGGGLLADGTSPTLRNNVFTGNTTLPPDAWAPEKWHETAHDGGAVSCLSGCSAVVVRNLFIANTTGVGRGAGFACDNEATKDRRAAPRIAENVFLRNTASVGADTARSGDGGAISFHGYCSGEIVDNVVAGNKAAKNNDGGGLFIALWSAPEVRGNIIVGNVADDDAGGLFVGGQKHHYGTPKDPVPPADAFFVSVTDNVLIGNRNGSDTSGGTRLTMMMRGRFAHNVVAESPGGVYGQRSELTVEHNTIADGARYEDVEGAAPGPAVFANNIILGERLWNAPIDERENCYDDPGFADDGRTFVPAEATYLPGRYQTRLSLSAEEHAAGTLEHRVVQAGDRWSVIQDHDAEHVYVWGDLSGADSVTVKPTYQLSPDSPCAGRGIAVQASERS